MVEVKITDNGHGFEVSARWRARRSVAASVWSVSASASACWAASSRSTACPGGRPRFASHCPAGTASSASDRSPGPDRSGPEPATSCRAAPPGRAAKAGKRRLNRLPPVLDPGITRSGSPPTQSGGKGDTPESDAESDGDSANLDPAVVLALAVVAAPDSGAGSQRAATDRSRGEWCGRSTAFAWRRPAHTERLAGLRGCCSAHARDVARGFFEHSVPTGRRRSGSSATTRGAQLATWVVGETLSRTAPSRRPEEAVAAGSPRLRIAGSCVDPMARCRHRRGPLRLRRRRIRQPAGLGRDRRLRDGSPVGTDGSSLGGRADGCCGGIDLGVEPALPRDDDVALVREATDEAAVTCTQAAAGLVADELDPLADPDVGPEACGQVACP